MRDVLLCTFIAGILLHTVRMNTERDVALSELEKQGLTIRSHSLLNDTWHIADGGLYSGYVASGDEWIELRRTQKLTMRGIRELG